MKKEICLLCKAEIDKYQDCENCGSKWDFSIINEIDKTLKNLFKNNKNLKDETYRKKYLELYKAIHATIPSELGLLGQAVIGVSASSMISQVSNSHLSFLEDINLQIKELSQKKVRKKLENIENEEPAEYLATAILCYPLLFFIMWVGENIPTGIINESIMVTTLFFFIKWIFFYPIGGILLMVSLWGILYSSYKLLMYPLKKLFAPKKLKGSNIKQEEITKIQNDIDNLRRKVLRKIPEFKYLLDI